MIPRQCVISSKLEHTGRLPSSSILSLYQRSSSHLLNTPLHQALVPRPIPAKNLIRSLWTGGLSHPFWASISEENLPKTALYPPASFSRVFHKMGVECTWHVRWLNKPAPDILRWYGRGCDDIYVNVALSSSVEGQPYSILFLRKGEPIFVHDSGEDVPPEYNKENKDSQSRVIEEQGKWHLPGGLCRENDRTIFEWLWTDI
ncbi:hypothetical protein F4801DRAFT_183129 [Xylaria longipes]|nr:hypothetical protein F4801DRAFT_183129 [Xylaria longipes]